MIVRARSVRSDAMTRIAVHWPCQVNSGDARPVSAVTADWYFQWRRQREPGGHRERENTTFCNFFLFIGQYILKANLMPASRCDKIVKR